MWDSATGKMKKDLTYQAEEMFMMHDEAVLCLNVSRDNELLVSGERLMQEGGQKPRRDAGRDKLRLGRMQGGTRKKFGLSANL